MINFLNTLSCHYPPTNFRVINVRPCTIQLHALLETLNPKLFLSQQASLIGPSQKKFWNFQDSPTVEVFIPNIQSYKVPTFIHLYRFQKDNGTKWGATGNMLRNMLRTLKTCWELDENTLGTTKPQKSNPQILPPLSALWALSLVAWNFYFQNCLSPFSTWANTPIIN
jgi:hypothetical protein